MGHDWGAMVAWDLCTLKPDRVKALVNLSVMYSPRNPNQKPLDFYMNVFGEDHYICRFQVHLHPLLNLFFVLIFPQMDRELALIHSNSKIRIKIHKACLLIFSRSILINLIFFFTRVY